MNKNVINTIANIFKALFIVSVVALIVSLFMRLVDTNAYINTFSYIIKDNIGSNRVILNSVIIIVLSIFTIMLAFAGQTAMKVVGLAGGAGIFALTMYNINKIGNVLAGMEYITGYYVMYIAAIVMMVSLVTSFVLEMISKYVLKQYKSSAKVNNVMIHIILGILAFIWILPILFVIMVSFKSEAGMQIATLLPDPIFQKVKAAHPGLFEGILTTKGYIPTLDNYKKLFTDTGSSFNFPKMFMNTLIISVFTCIISTFFVLSVSYVMSRMRFKMRKPFMNVALILGMFPGFMSMVAVYYILKALGLTEGSLIRVALIMVYSGGSGLGFYVAKGFFDTIPKSIDEAAYIDGATRFQVFTRITIPLSKPIIVYTVINSFMSPWLDFIFAKVICRANSDYYTVSVGLWNMLEKEYIFQWFNCFAAGAVCISIPIATLFMITQRFYREGVSGAVKG